jgi:hypothetical protein
MESKSNKIVLEVWGEALPANDSIQGNAMQILDALSMALLFILDLPNIFTTL